VRVTLPRRWLGLIGLLLVVSAVIVWASVSSVPTTLHTSGYFIPQNGLRVIQSPASGTVQRLDVETGDHVVANQAVGVVDPQGGSPVVIRAPETGVVSETDALRQAYVAAGDRLALVVYAYVPTNIAPGLAPGTLAHISFGAGIGAAFGYAVGHIESVSQFPATPRRLDFILQDPSVVSGVRGSGPSNEVVVALDQSARTPSGLVWGSGSGPPGELPAGLPATVTLIVGSHHPIDDVL
jgi:multidrug efflux pump subunit AcrA (membrane-fusion protein)